MFFVKSYDCFFKNTNYHILYVKKVIFIDDTNKHTHSYLSSFTYLMNQSEFQNIVNS